MDQEISRQRLANGAWFRSQASVYGIYDGKCNLMAGSFQSTLCRTLLLFYKYYTLIIFSFTTTVIRKDTATYNVIK